MVNEKIQNVLSRLEKDIDYENSHRDEIPGEKRLNCISRNIGMFYNTLLMSINAKKILEIGISSLIKIRKGEARKILDEIKEEFGENYFDFIFIDADKESYIEYFDLCLPLVRKGGIIGADNILLPERFNEMMADYLSHVRSNPNVQSVTVPIDNGEEVTIKL